MEITFDISTRQITFQTIKHTMMTAQQRQNLAILTLYVHSLPPDYEKFRMSCYLKMRKDGDTSARYAMPLPECGTSACFCGHGPTAGIAPLKGERWNEYAVRVFGASMGEPASSLLWMWLFAMSWPNDTAHACARAAWVLLHDEEDVTSPGGYRWNEWPSRGKFEAFAPDWQLIELIAKGEAA